MFVCACALTRGGLRAMFSVQVKQVADNCIAVLVSDGRHGREHQMRCVARRACKSNRIKSNGDSRARAPLSQTCCTTTDCGQRLSPFFVVVVVLVALFMFECFPHGHIGTLMRHDAHSRGCLATGCGRSVRGARAPIGRPIGARTFAHRSNNDQRCCCACSSSSGGSAK